MRLIRLIRHATRKLEGDTQISFNSQQINQIMSSTEVTFKQGEDCCGCNCTDEPLGTGGCCFTFWCPCFAFCTASDNAKVDDLGILYAVLGFIPVGNLISATILSMHVEEKRNLKKHGCVWHCCNSYFNLCTCHTCRIVNECKVYEAEGAVGASAPTSSKMVRAQAE